MDCVRASMNALVRFIGGYAVYYKLLLLPSNHMYTATTDGYIIDLGHYGWDIFS